MEKKRNVIKVTASMTKFTSHLGFCSNCKHLQERGFIWKNFWYWRCAAFPLGIPRQIRRSNTPHFEKIPNQEGDFVYETTDKYGNSWKERLRSNIKDNIEKREEKIAKSKEDIKNSILAKLENIAWEKVRFVVASINHISRYFMGYHSFIHLSNENIFIPKADFWQTSSFSYKGIYEGLSKLRDIYNADFSNRKRHNTIIFTMDKEGHIEISLQNSFLEDTNGRLIEDGYDDYPADLKCLLPLKDGQLVNLTEFKKHIKDILAGEAIRKPFTSQQVQTKLEERGFEHIELSMLFSYLRRIRLDLFGHEYIALIKQEIQSLINNENREKPLSDEKIKIELHFLGFVHASRRMVANLREILKIPVARIRRQQYRESEQER